MRNEFAFADLHCHPNLKTYGHSFDKCKGNKKCNVWYYQPPGFFTKLVNITAGITRFSQSDFTTLSKGGAKVIFVSLYPFEKGFFINSAGRGPLSAWLSDKITGIGYQRVRNLQQHGDYFEDLGKEYQFFINSQKSNIIDGSEFSWKLTNSWLDVDEILNKENEIAVILTIEGAHVFNSGLEKFGRTTSEKEILENIRKVKEWEFPPLFITFAHNFDNDLCGHANSLEPIKSFVDQSERLNSGFTQLGRNVLCELLSHEYGHPIYIDIKHMSLSARKEYFEIIETDFQSNLPPTLVSHGAVNGLKWTDHNKPDNKAVFYPSDINFFDEEIIKIGKTGGLFALQFDTRRIVRKELVKKKLISLFRKENANTSAEMLWFQIKHIAEVLDSAGYFGWGTACIGSDYDGTIDPLPGLWTAEYFPLLSDKLLILADNYLTSTNPLTLPENKKIDPEELVHLFFIGNSIRFLRCFY